MELISFGVFDKPIFLDGTDGTKKLSIVLQSKIEANTPRAADLITSEINLKHHVEVGGSDLPCGVGIL